MTSLSHRWCVRGTHLTVLVELFTAFVLVVKKPFEMAIIIDGGKKGNGVVSSFIDNYAKIL